jgi:hypothetical protein
MIGVALRFKWIPWAMFVGLGPEPVFPIREAIIPRSLSPSGDGERKWESFPSTMPLAFSSKLPGARSMHRQTKMAAALADETRRLDLTSMASIPSK